MDGEKIKKFIQLIKMYNDEPNKRVFRVDRDCYVIFTGFSALDEKPFIRIGYSKYIEKFKQYISNAIIAAGYLSSLKEEIKQIETEEYETNFIVPESIYNVVLKFIRPTSHHKVNVNVIDKQTLEDYSSVLREISQKYKSYVLLYDNGNFAVTFSGKKIFDMFSAINRDLTTSKFLFLISSKTTEIYPLESVVRLGNSYTILTNSGNIAVIGHELDENKLIRNLYPTSKIKTVVGNDVIPLIDFIRLLNSRSSIKVYTTKEVYDDFKKFSLGIKFVDVSDKIDIIKNINIVSEKEKYYIPLKDNNGIENDLVMSENKENLKNPIILEEGEVFLLNTFAKSKLPSISTDIFLIDPDEIEIEKVTKEFEANASKIFSRKVLAEIMREFENDTNRIIRDRRRFEELAKLYEEIQSLSLSERADILVKAEKLEGTEKEKAIKSSIEGKEQETRLKKASTSKEKVELTTKAPKEKVKIMRELILKNWWIIALVGLILTLGSITFVFRDTIKETLTKWSLEIQQTSDEKKISNILNKLEDTYEPELTKIQNELGITITDYDIWVYVNKVALINGYKPLTYKKPKKWEDPDWIYPGMKLKLVDYTVITVRPGDNMWNISKRKLIEDYIKKNFAVVTVKSKSGTNTYYVKKRKQNP
jgi:hypothetical protein